MKNLRDEITDLLYHAMKCGDYYSNIADAILNLPEMVEMRAKVELYDDEKHSECWKREAQLRLLMSGLIVRHKCPTCHMARINGYNDENTNFSECPDCHGTGYITRPATVEEVREFLETVLEWNGKPINHNFKITNSTVFTFTLKSGGTLFMKEKDESGKA